jgi:hypothetical protein
MEEVMKEILRKIFYFNTLEAREHFIKEEYNDLNKEIAFRREQLNELERKRNRIEILAFGA